MKTTTLFIVFCTILINATAQGFLIKEDFDDGIPNGWINVAVSGSHKWKSGLDGSNSGTGDQGINNIDGTKMVIFDDDSLGTMNKNNTVELKSPRFNNSDKILSYLEFDYNFRSITDLVPAAFDSLYVEIYDGLGWQQIFSVSNSDCGRYSTGFSLTNCELFGFPHAKIDITPYANKNCQISFRYHDGNEWAFYTALDNIWISYLDSNDVGVVDIINLSTSCGLEEEEVSVIIANYGLNPVSNFDVSLSINNGSQIITETVNDTIDAGDSLSYQFSTLADLTEVRGYQITAYTNNNLDNIHENDTAAIEIVNKIVKQIPYQESFENNQHGWEISGLNPSWERGIPLGKRIDIASDSLRVFATNLSETYNDNELSYLTTPCIEKVDSLDQLLVSFDLFRAIEVGDRLTVEYATDNSENWKSLPNDALRTNWYNSGGNSFWDGLASDWQSLKSLITGLEGVTTLQFRFKFQTNSFNPNSNQNDGVAVDNFSLDTLKTIDLGIVSINNPKSTSSNLGLTFENPSITIANYGSNRLDSFEVSYIVDSSITVVEKVIDTINPRETYQYTFKDSIDFNSRKIYNIDFKVEVMGDQDSLNNEIFNHIIDQESSLVFNVPFRETFDEFPQTIEPIDFQSLPNQWLSIPHANTRYDLMSWKTGTTSDLAGNIEKRGHIFFSSNVSTLLGGSTSLISPFIAIRSLETTLSYWYYRSGGNNLGGGDLFIDVFDGSEWHNAVDSVKGFVFGGPGPFEEKRYNLGSNFLNKNIRIRFRTTTGTFAFNNDNRVAIDDVSIYVPKEKDIKLTNISNFGEACFFDSEIRIYVENTGSVSIAADSILLFYQVNKGTVIRDTADFGLGAGAKKEHTFSKIADFDPGINSIKIWSQAKGIDSNFDTLTVLLETNVIDGLIQEDFESVEVRSCFSNSIKQLNNSWKISSNPNDWLIVDYEHCTGTSDNYPTLRSNSVSNKYLSSNGTQFTQPTIVSSCFSISTLQDPVLTFDFFKGPNSSNLVIEVSSDGTNFTNLKTIQGTKQNSVDEDWINEKISIANDITNIRFKTTSFSITNPTAVSLDNIQIYDRIEQDITITNISFPKSDCDLSNSEIVSIDLINNGSDTIHSGSITAKLFLNNSLESTESISSAILSDSTITFSFTKTLDLSAVNSSNTIEVELELSNDSNLVGNSFKLNEVKSYTKIPGYIENFETFNRGFYQAFSQEANQDGLDILKEGWIATPNSISNEFHWNVQKPLAQEKNINYGGTPSNATGPANNHTPGGETFIYTEATYGDLGDTANFTLPCVDLSSMNTGSLQFWYHKFGAEMGDLFVDIYANGSWNNTVDSVIGETQLYHLDAWKKKVISLNQFAGNDDVKIRFRAIRGVGEKGDMAIDNIHLFDSLTVGIENTAVLQEMTEDDILLFPNPNNGSFNIQVSNDIIGLSYYIIDLQGKVINADRVQSKITSLDLSEKPKGIYMLRFPDLGKTKKVVLY